ncbi:uncharacterized protein LOC144053499 isoform X2 [Vanacampus margaritifer]
MGFKEDASNSYPRELDPQAFTKDHNSVAQTYSTENNKSSVIPTNNELDESPLKSRHQHRDSGFQHPFKLLVQEHTKDTAVEGISFPDMDNFEQFIETLKSSFLTPGKDLEHFQTARGLMLNEIATRRPSKEENDDNEGIKDNKVWREQLSSAYGQSEEDVSYPVLSPSITVPGSDNSMSRILPRMHNRSNNHGSQSPYRSGYSNEKTGGDWWRTDKLPEKSQFPSNTLLEEVAPLSPQGMYPLNGHYVASKTANESSIKRLKKTQLEGKVAPSQQGSYGKSVYVKASRMPIVSWVFKDGQSKQLVQPTAAKYSYDVNINPRAQKSAELSAQSPRGLREHIFLREPDHLNHVLFKAPLNSPLDSFLRQRPPLLNIHKPRLSEQIPDTRNQQSQERHEPITNTISQRLDLVQRGVASRDYAKPYTNSFWMSAMQPKITQTNGIYRFPNLQRPTAIFHQGLPVYRGPRKPIAHRKKYGFQSRSSYARTSVALSRSQYMPRKGVFMRGQTAQVPWIHKRTSTFASHNGQEAADE